MKVRLKKADLGVNLSPVQGAPNIYSETRAPGGAPNLMGNIPSSSPPSENPGNGINVNWNHVMASYIAQNMASGLISRFSPNSQQNTTQKFNRQQFSPLNFLPYTPNNSQQAKYGQMRRGGQLGPAMGSWPPITTKMDDGGYIDAESMRKWILGDDEAQPAAAPPPQQQQQQQGPDYSDALQFAQFVQLMGLDQADGEKEPEDQEESWMFGQGGPVTDGELYSILGNEADDESIEYLKKGGWIQKANASIKRRGTKGVCTGSNFGGPSCRPGTRRYALAKTFKAMAKHRKHKKEDGGPIKEQVSTTAHQIPSPHLPFRNNGQVVNPSYEFVPQGASKGDSTQYRQGFYDALQRMSSGKMHPFDEKAYYWAGFNSQTANARYPGVDVPGMPDAFNAGTREAYINMPAGSFQYKKSGGKVTGKGIEYNLSPEDVIGLIGKGYQLDV